MANRYWVGGTASWDGTAGTKWATTSGGTGGASVPTTADDVYFDATSTGTVTIASGNTGAKSINCTGFTGTITGSTAITVAGSITLSTGMTYTHSGVVTITGTGTLTTAGKTFTFLTIDGSGITVTLGDALNMSTRDLVVTRGTFDTANYTVTAGVFSSSNSNTRTINFGSSTLTFNQSSPFNFSTATNLTFNAGTSQINISNSNSSVNGGSQTFYNFSFTSTSGGSRTLSGVNTFNNLTLNVSAAGLTQLVLSSNQTVNGTFTCAGSGATSRGFVRSNILGTTRTLTVATLSANDCDFRDITITGSAAGSSPTRAGDCGGNSGINFPAPKTVYRVGASTTWQGNNSWALTSGGTGSNDNFPLAQDTAVINEDTALTGSLTVSLYNVGTLDASTRTTGITLSKGANTVYYGNYTLGSGVTISGTSTQTFSGRGTQTFTSAGKTITFPIIVDKPTGAFELGSAITSSQGIILTRGIFDAKNYNITCVQFNSINTNTRTITMGSGLWTLSGTGVGVNRVWGIDASGLTFNKDTANILLSDTSSSNRDFLGGGLSYNKLTIGGNTGTSILIIFGSNSFTEIASTKTVAHTIRFFTNQGTIDTWSVTGTAGNVVTVNSTSAGARRNFTLTNVTSGIDYLSVTDIGELNGNKFYVGANSTDGGNNSNVYFTVPPTPSINTFGMLLMF